MASIEPPASERFIVVYRFMWQKLGLDGVALRVFARIYGFCKDGDSEFFESRSATADFLGTTPRTVTRSINELVEKGLIEQVGVRASASGNMTRSYRLTKLMHIETSPPDKRRGSSQTRWGSPSPPSATTNGTSGRPANSR